MRCPKCNKNVSRLYKSYCASCLSVLAMEAVDSADGVYELDGVAQGNGDSGSLRDPEEFVKLLKWTKKEEAKPERNTSLDELKRLRKEELLKRNMQKAIKGIGLTDSEKLAYKPIIMSLVSKYINNLANGRYRVCKKADYPNIIGGTKVIEAKGGLVVYEKGVYYNPGGQIPDSYADDEYEADYSEKGSLTGVLIQKEIDLEEEDGYAMEYTDEEEE